MATFDSIRNELSEALARRADEAVDMGCMRCGARPVIMQMVGDLQLSTHTKPEDPDNVVMRIGQRVRFVCEEHAREPVVW